jgi:acyl-CoA reductase-like NAD-dependent aldehyde dehydrogenase
MKQELITFSPIDGREIVRRAYATEVELSALLARAATAQREWSARPLAERQALVSAAVEHFVAGRAEVAEAITRQMGRPLRYTPGEVDGFAARAPHDCHRRDGLAAGRGGAAGWLYALYQT